MNLLIEYWPVTLVAAIVFVWLFYIALRPRQRVALSDKTPVRPHMSAPTNKVAELAGGAASSILAAKSPVALTPASGPPDDLAIIKGIGPKLATLLNQRGITRFDQLASLTPSQVDDLDNDLGAFRGRLVRDLVTEQADYLARGDIDGFEQRFGMS